MVNVHQSPKYPYHIGNWGRRIQRCQHFDRKLGNSSFCACVVQIWSNLVSISSHIHPQQYPLCNRALLLYCNSASTTASAGMLVLGLDLEARVLGLDNEGQVIGLGL